MPAQNKPLRILDFTPNLGMGGIATGMMNVLEMIDRDRYQIDFLLFDYPDKYYESRAKTLGSTIYRIGSHRNFLRFAREFFKIVKNNGPFDVIHSHAYTHSGYMMVLAKLAGIPVRITHAHNDHRHTERAKPFMRRLYTQFMLFLINRFSTAGLTISQEAGEALFGENWQADPRWVQIPVGTDFRVYGASCDIPALRTSLGINGQPTIIGVVGRFVEQKNHDFVIDFIARYAERRPDCRFLFIGDGTLLPAIKTKAQKLGVLDLCVFAGIRADLPLIYSHIMDAVLFPSLHEGLGRVAIEAQAAGVPVVASEHIPLIADLYAGGIKRLSLSAPMDDWCDAMDKALARGKLPLDECLETARQSKLSMDHHIKELEQFYDRQAVKGGLR